MDEKAVKLLEQYGLSDRESIIYLHLLGSGSHGAGEIAKALRLRRMEAYRIVKGLADEGIVIATPGKPVKYTAEPMESVLALLMEKQMSKLKEMEQAKNELLSIGRSFPSVPEPFVEYRFRMLQGREHIYSQMERMIESARLSLDVMLTRNDLVQLHLLGVGEKVKEAVKRGIMIRLISSIDSHTIEAVESLKGCAISHSDDFSVGRMVIADSSQIMISLVLDDSQGRKNDRDIAVWTDSRDYAEMMKTLFEKALISCTSAEERIAEVKGSRKIQEKTQAIVDVIRATLPLEGWSVTSPIKFSGISGNEYEFSVLLKKGKDEAVIDVVLGRSEDGVRDYIISSIMKGIDVKTVRLIVLASPFGQELAKLASLIGVTLIDGGDTVRAVAALRKSLRA
jgi:sugar-specific transcriptional regulator TrmB